jgi:hypothetical protein
MLRVLATVNKGMTDKPTICVFPWEVQLLEVLHGDGSVEVQDIDSLSSVGAKAIVQRIKLKHTEHAAPELREQLLAFCNTLPDGIEPFENPRAEYERMVAVYGMHPEVKQSVVENVYGRFESGAFSAVVKSVADAHNEAEVEHTPAAVDVEDMAGNELREALRARGVNFKNNDPLAGLRARLKAILRLEDEGLEFDPNGTLAELEELAGFVTAPQ